MYSRALNLKIRLTHASILLFGPRQTGKTTLLSSQFPAATTYNLLETEIFRELAARPEMIRRRLTGNEDLIIIDEIQRLPTLLNEVHAMIATKPGLRFLLTGSSARSLRRGGVNLLGGRAWQANLFPLVSPEVEFQQLERRLTVGSLPAILDSARPQEALKAYVGLYLSEEIRAEGLVKSIETFSRFLDLAAFSNGGILNFTKIGADTGVPPRTVREHFHLLQDTLLGTMVEPYRGTRGRKVVATAKFYLFDVGLANHLMGRTAVNRGSPEFGQALEHQVYLELKAYLSYNRLDLPLNFWRTHTQLEVDFLVGEAVAIEVKGAARVSERDFRGLRELAKETTLRRRIVVSLEPHRWRSDDGIEVFPAEEFLRALWAGEILGS